MANKKVIAGIAAGLVAIGSTVAIGVAVFNRPEDDVILPSDYIETTLVDQEFLSDNDISTEPISSEELTEDIVRQEAQGRTVYITPNGERYHYSASCGGENSREISIDDVGDREPCQKCTQ